MISSGRLRVLAVIAWAVFWSSSSAFGQAGTSAAGAPQAAAAAIAACFEGLILHRIARHDDTDPRPAFDLLVQAALGA